MTREKSFETAQLDQSYQMSNVSKNDFVENANKQEQDWSKYTGKHI